MVSSRVRGAEGAEGAEAESVIDDEGRVFYLDGEVMIS